MVDTLSSRRESINIQLALSLFTYVFTYFDKPVPKIAIRDYWVPFICAKLLHSPLILCDPMDCSLPGSSVHGILQARTLEWGATPSSRGSSWPRDHLLCLLHWQVGSLPLAPPRKPLLGSTVLWIVLLLMEKVWVPLDFLVSPQPHHWAVDLAVVIRDWENSA